MSDILAPIENILTELLGWLHSSVGLTWAWAIVVLTLIVRIVILPLTIKQIRSMQRLQVHAPELKAIQQKYKHDKQKMNEEVMKFYRENNVNPLASCLPILLQLPVFLALFFVLRDFDEEVLPDYPNADLSWLNIVPNITESDQFALVGLAAPRHLRREPARLDVLHVDDGGPAPALHLLRAALPRGLLRHQLPDRRDALLVDDEPLDGGPGPDHAPARAEAPAAAEADLAHSAQGASRR